MNRVCLNSISFSIVLKSAINLFQLPSRCLHSVGIFEMLVRGEPVSLLNSRHCLLWIRIFGQSDVHAPLFCGAHFWSKQKIDGCQEQQTSRRLGLLSPSHLKTILELQLICFLRYRPCRKEWLKVFLIFGIETVPTETNGQKQSPACWPGLCLHKQWYFLSSRIYLEKICWMAGSQLDVLFSS